MMPSLGVALMQQVTLGISAAGHVWRQCRRHCSKTGSGSIEAGRAKERLARLWKGSTRAHTGCPDRRTLPPGG